MKIYNYSYDNFAPSQFSVQYDRIGSTTSACSLTGFAIGGVQRETKCYAVLNSHGEYQYAVSVRVV